MDKTTKSLPNSGQWVVKRLRQISGLSKREIARRAQTTPAALVEYESGRRSPSLSSLYRIADACGLEVQITFRRKNPVLNPEVCGERLAQVLALSDALPKRPAAAQSAKAQYVL
jgi:transcriptional regulator with XRE-family HTH domain